MDYQQDTTQAPLPISRIKKFDRYVQRNDAAPRRIMQQRIPSGDLYGRLRRSPSPSVPVVSAQLLGQKDRLMHSKTNIFGTPVAKSAMAVSYQPMSIAYQAALFAVHQARASRQDILAEQFNQPFSEDTTTRRKLTRSQKVFYGVGSLVFLFALTVSLQSVLTNRQAKEQLGVLGAQTQTPDEYGVQEGNGDEPAESEVPKAALAAYKVSPELPRYIRIPALNVFARIKHTGVTKDGAIDAPANINDASWYNQSAKPGSEEGTSLLLGHVSGWTASGVFKKINQMKPGMRFEIEKGSGEKITYEVTRGESVPLDNVNMGVVLTPEERGEHDLKLMTCSGRFNRESDHYEERYIVYAKIVR